MHPSMPDEYKASPESDKDVYIDSLPHLSLPWLTARDFCQRRARRLPSPHEDNPSSTHSASQDTASAARPGIVACAVCSSLELAKIEIGAAG